MYLPELIHEINDHGIQLDIVDGKLRLSPRSAITPDLRQSVLKYKQQILVFLIRQQGGTVIPYNNPPTCHNPFTPHASHKLPWECDPKSCLCYQEFGYPRYCQGAPCRWIWPQETPAKEVTQ
jgi:hypothetical protein